MAILRTGADCQINDPNSGPITIESLRFPLDSSMRIVFTGYYNGFGVEVRATEEICMLYHMGCYGKGSSSRSKPKMTYKDGGPRIMRKRQFLKRNYWYKKFADSKETSDADIFLKNIDELASKVISDCAKQNNRDVIDLISSDDENSHDSDEVRLKDVNADSRQDFVVIVPNSDSEDDNYFAKLRPKCCVNKIEVQEKLMLTLQEAFFLMFGLGCLQIIDKNNAALSVDQCWKLFTKTDREFLPKYVVYHFYRTKGYIVKPGIKFGGDFLLYEEGPGVNHSTRIIKIKYGSQEFDWVSILGHVRMANTTVKDIVIVEVIEPKESLINLPKDLNKVTVREMLVTRKIPEPINC